MSNRIGDFLCTCCGDCCSGNMNIFINIYDLYKMAKFLDLSSTGELFKKGYIVMEMGQHRTYLPKLQFKTRPYKFCPFLINSLDDDMNLSGYCKLHPYIKPLVCILAPISKEIDLDYGNIDYEIVLPTPSCPGKVVNRDEYISGTIERLKPELEFETRYFKLLETLDYREDKLRMKKFFTFNLDKSFKDIIHNLETFS